MMKKYTLIIFLISFVIPLNAKDNGILNPQLYNVWTLEELALKMMTQEEIDYYVIANPEDSMKQINYGDKIIVIESKKNLGNIYEELGLFKKVEDSYLEALKIPNRYLINDTIG